MCNVRGFQYEDVDRLAYLAEEVLADVTHSADRLTRERILELLADWGGEVAIAEGSDGKMIGYAVYLLGTDEINLIDVGVLHDRRRRGVGRTLIRSVKKRLTFGGVRMIVAVVPERNTGAQHFLRACGFTARRVERDYVEHATGSGLSVQDGYLFTYEIDNFPW